MVDADRYNCEWSIRARVLQSATVGVHDPISRWVCVGLLIFHLDDSQRWQGIGGYGNATNPAKVALLQADGNY